MFALPRFGFYLGFKGSTGRHGSEIKFQIAGMKKSIHSECGRKVKSFLGDGQDTFSGWTVKKALINTLKARISGFKVKEQRKNLCWLNHFFKVTISGPSMNMKIAYKKLESRWKGYAEKGYWGKVSLPAPAESSNPLR